MDCKDCVHYDVCMLVDLSDDAENVPCGHFVAFEDCELVVRCKDCAHSAYPDEKIVWCKWNNRYMPLRGFCNGGKERT